MFLMFFDETAKSYLDVRWWSLVKVNAQIENIGERWLNMFISSLLADENLTGRGAQKLQKHVETEAKRSYLFKTNWRL